MEFSREVTDRIHQRSLGVPRLINVISDAALVFGYGEERCEIDASLVDDVIADLDSTGVLGPSAAPNRHASVVPADPAAATGAPPRDRAPGVTMTPTAIATAQSVADEKRAKALAAREASVQQREREIEQREKELVEQRRVLTDQYRLLKTKANETGRQVASSWPPPAPVARTGARAIANDRRRQRSVWRRVKAVLLGTPETVLEDSL
jgi:general secretion pathway protein A